MQNCQQVVVLSVTTKHAHASLGKKKTSFARGNTNPRTARKRQKTTHCIGERAVSLPNKKPTSCHTACCSPSMQTQSLLVPPPFRLHITARQLKLPESRTLLTSSLATLISLSSTALSLHQRQTFHLQIHVRPYTAARTTCETWFTHHMPQHDRLRKKCDVLTQH